MTREAVIVVRDLRKTFKTPFRRRRIESLRGVNLEVRRGEIFGFLGPNGAGKTTTIRILMGLIRATGGDASILGHTIPSRAARERVGFLPEHPYFYDYLTVGELLDLMGRLFGMDRRERKQRADVLIERVGLGRAQQQSLKKFSKGMLQRAGLAQALMNDPDVIVLDEPMSGLDPIGRKEVRDLILELREQGKTVFFSSHIMSDVEVLCDRVAIVARGQIQSSGAPSELVGNVLRGTDIVWRLPTEGADAVEQTLGTLGRARRFGAELTLSLAPDADIDATIVRAHAAGAKVMSVTPQHETLEELFLRQIAAADDGGGPGAGARSVS